MKHVSLSILEDKIVRPGFEKHLKPLVMYRGNMTLGRAHRLWNTMLSGMEHEATFSDITQRLVHNPDVSQLCGSESKVTGQYLTSFCIRLLDNPKVLGEIPGFHEYIDWMLPFYKRHSAPQRVSETTYRVRNMGAGGWRRLGKREQHLTGGNVKQTTKGIVYPFLIHDGGKPEHILLRKVNAAVPKYLDPETRADICQDLMVGILCGDFSEDDLNLPAKEMTKRVQKMFPTKYGPLSLDAVMPGTDDFRLIDTLSTEDSLWARI
jgi:hypothetical protein